MLFIIYIYHYISSLEKMLWSGNPGGVQIRTHSHIDNCHDCSCCTISGLMRSGAQIHCSQELVHVPWTSHPSTGKLSTSQNKPEAPQSWPLWPYVSGWCWLNHHQSPPLGSAVVPVSSQAMSRMSSFSSQCRDAGRRLTRPGWSSHVAVAIECHWFIEINSLTSTGHALPLYYWSRFDFVACAIITGFILLSMAACLVWNVAALQTMQPCSVFERFLSICKQQPQLTWAD